MTKRMHFHLSKLVIVFSKATEEIIFSDVTYFFGQMGSGKTSIARLLDYCLGGSISLSPALQSEFVSAELILAINNKNVSIERPRNSDQVIVSWNSDKDKMSLAVPVSSANGIVLEGTKVEVLSDLLYYLADIDAPKVRRSKLKEDSDLQRLSFRDLFWYCYVDQDNIDSSFFHLGVDEHPFKRGKSKDVLRFILGFHQEQVAELESEVQRLHIQKLQLTEAAKSLKDVIKDSNIGSENEIINSVNELKIRHERNKESLYQLRNSKTLIPHSTDLLKIEARNLGFEIEALDNALHEISKKIDQDMRHKNEIFTSSIKIQRLAGARAVLGGVNFQTCPRCAQSLPIREENHCIVCNQEEPKEGTLNVDSEILMQDAKYRISELEEIIKLQQEQMFIIKRRKDEFLEQKYLIDSQLSKQLEDYDSAYLSNALNLERENSQIEQQIKNLEKLILLPQKVEYLLNLAAEIEKDLFLTRDKLKEERIKAEADLTNLTRLKELFLDCLLRSKIPGIHNTSKVSIDPRDFLPVVVDPQLDEVAVTSFANISSGGKKTLFKACFAIAVHRLAVEIGGILPTLLIIDSPMKNISERENYIQFENFHKLLYDLAQDEFSETQLILIDKEYFDPPISQIFNMSVRHMTLDNPIYPPLIPYYK